MDFGSSLSITGTVSSPSSVTLTKSNPGILTLAADDSATLFGQVTVSAGILQITNANALGVSGSSSNFTTVLSGAQLQVNGTGATPITEILNVQGVGPLSDGALLNVAGANTWSGPVTLFTDTFLGATAGSLNITGQISENSTGLNISKEGKGTIIFSHVGGNTYTGNTTIDDGILNIRDPLALGPSNGATPQSTQVNSIPVIRARSRSRTRQAPGSRSRARRSPSMAAASAASGRWTTSTATTSGTASSRWALAGAAGNGVNVGSALKNLTFTGLIKDTTSHVSVTKVGPGTVTFTQDDTYTGNTTVMAGTLAVTDSQALGPQGPPTPRVTVQSGATLQLQVDQVATWNNSFVKGPDSITSSNKSLNFFYPLTINGLGVGGGGAVRSLSGINFWPGGITLNSTAAIGVDPDPNAHNDASYFTLDYSLTVDSNIGGGNGSTLTKVDLGQLILPTANSYSGPTDIKAGWVTIENNQSLGAWQAQQQTTTNGGGVHPNPNVDVVIPGVPDSVQPATTVEAGASLMLMPNVGTSLDLAKNLVLSGTGITHPFSLISQKGRW